MVIIISQVSYYVRLHSLSIPRAVWYKAISNGVLCSFPLVSLLSQVWYKGISSILLAHIVLYYLRFLRFLYPRQSGTRPFRRIILFPFVFTSLSSQIWHKANSRRRIISIFTSLFYFYKSCTKLSQSITLTQSFVSLLDCQSVRLYHVRTTCHMFFVCSSTRALRCKARAQTNVNFNSLPLVSRWTLLWGTNPLILCISLIWEWGGKLLTISIFSWFGLILPLQILIHSYSHPKWVVFLKLELLLILCWRVIASENVLKKIFHILISKICHFKFRVFDTQLPLMINCP